MRLSYKIFGSQWLFIIFNLKQLVYIHSGKSLARNFSRNLFWYFSIESCISNYESDILTFWFYWTSSTHLTFPPIGPYGDPRCREVGSLTSHQGGSDLGGPPSHYCVRYRNLPLYQGAIRNTSTGYSNVLCWKCRSQGVIQDHLQSPWGPHGEGPIQWLLPRFNQEHIGNLQ